MVGRVLVARAAADALVAARTERPLAGAAGALRAGAVAGEEDDTDVRRATRVVEHAVQLVHGVRAERVEHLRAVERHAHAAEFDAAVVGDVRQILEPLDDLPGRGVERVARLLLRLVIHAGQPIGASSAWCVTRERTPSPRRGCPPAA